MEPRKKLSLSELEETPEYIRLTPKQKLFVAEYVSYGLETGTYDWVRAVRFPAYNCKSPESARVMSYALRGNISIIAAINRHFNAEPIEQFIVEIDRAIRNKRLTTAQLGALKLKADLLGYSAKLPGMNHQATGVVPEDIGKPVQSVKPRKRGPRKPLAKKINPEYGF